MRHNEMYNLELYATQLRSQLHAMYRGTKDMQRMYDFLRSGGSEETISKLYDVNLYFADGHIPGTEGFFDSLKRACIWLVNKIIDFINVILRWVGVSTIDRIRTDVEAKIDKVNAIAVDVVKAVNVTQGSPVSSSQNQRQQRVSSSDNSSAEPSPPMSKAEAKRWSADVNSLDREYSKILSSKGTMLGHVCTLDSKLGTINKEIVATIDAYVRGGVHAGGELPAYYEPPQGSQIEYGDPESFNDGLRLLDNALRDICSGNVEPTQAFNTLSSFRLQYNTVGNFDKLGYTFLTHELIGGIEAYCDSIRNCNSELDSCCQRAQAMLAELRPVIATLDGADADVYNDSMNRMHEYTKQLAQLSEIAIGCIKCDKWFYEQVATPYTDRLVAYHKVCYNNFKAGTPQ